MSRIRTKYLECGSAAAAFVSKAAAALPHSKCSVEIVTEGIREIYDVLKNVGFGFGSGFSLTHPIFSELRCTVWASCRVPAHAFEAKDSAILMDIPCGLGKESALSSSGICCFKNVPECHWVFRRTIIA
jgi:hypothetical protein